MGTRRAVAMERWRGHMCPQPRGTNKAPGLWSGLSRPLTQALMTPRQLRQTALWHPGGQSRLQDFLGEDVTAKARSSLGGGWGVRLLSSEVAGLEAEAEPA